MAIIRWRARRLLSTAPWPVCVRLPRKNWNMVMCMSPAGTCTKNPCKTTDGTTSHLTEETTSQSTKPPKNGGKVAGYNPANDTGQVIGYSHPTKQPEDVCQVVGYSHSIEWLVIGIIYALSLKHISEPTRLGMISYAVFCLKKKK